MNEKQSKARQAIQNLARHVETESGRDAVDFALKQFDSAIQVPAVPDLKPPTRLQIGTSTVDKLPGIFPHRNDE